MVKRKRLFLDIEVSPNIGFFWQPGHKVNIGYENIIQERAIICVCYKWEGEKKVQFLTWDAKKSDKKLLKELVKVMESAVEVIGHNSDSFDLKWIRTRALKFGLNLPANCVSIDTLKAARSKFRFNSNRLDYLAKFLDVGGKIKTDFNLWKDIVLNGCEKSMSRMVRYCKEDVRILERVFEKINPYLPSKTNYHILGGGSRKGSHCPECGSSNIKKNGREATLAGMIRQKLTCKNCGKHFKKHER